MPEITRNQILRLRYIQLIPRDDRAVPLCTYFDPASRQWSVPLDRSGELILLDAEPISGSYLAYTPVDPVRDFHFPLGTLITRHLSFPEAYGGLGKLENCLHRCAAVLENYHLLWRQRHETNRSSTLLVTSELEYLLLLLRSSYDFLQQVTRHVLRRLVHLDESSRRVVQDLSRSFADVVIRSEQVVAEDKLQRLYGLPPSLAAWYSAEAEFFCALRRLRNGIAHYGSRPPTVFEVDWGFAIAPNEPPWNQFAEWPPEKLWNGKLGALRSVFVPFILHSIHASSRFANIISESVQLPPPITDLRLFVRSPFGSWLVNLEKMRDQPWEELAG